MNPGYPRPDRSKGIGQRAVCEKLYHHGGVQNNQRASRNSRTICAALRLAGIRLAC
jgi:hypothetical protein